MPGRSPIEWYQNTSSKPWGAVAMITGVAIAVLGAVAGPSAIAITAGLLLAALAYASIWRPAVGVDAESAHLRGMYSTTVVPLAAIDSVTITRTLALSVIGKRYVSSAVSQTLRRAALGPQGGRGVLGMVKADPKPTYSDLVEDELGRRIQAARLEQRAPQGSEAQAALAGRVSRSISWPDVAVSAVLFVAFLVSFFL
jgi:hypothetical protein